MKYKVGDKFIVEIDEINCKKSELYPYRLELGLGVWEKEESLDALERYEPHDTAEDAWKLARKIELMDCLECEDAFGTRDVNIVNQFSYTEAKELYEKWKSDKEIKEIKPGDEVVDITSNKAIVISNNDEDTCYLFYADYSNYGCDWEEKCKLKKTGRHFDITPMIEFFKGGSE